MRVYDLIWKKREGGELSRDEIHFLIEGFVKGDIPDYQMSALCMAIFFRGMTFDECTTLTLEMAGSGAMVDLSSIPGVKVDKHSTGGVGDKTSLVLMPLVAAAGVPAAKMSGRGLGHTGGTIDKLESIPGFKTSLPHQDFLEQVRRIGIALVGQTGNLVPADKKLYALRDLTATIDSIPLIASSIVSKKLAAGADAVVLDVKFGDGAFMRDYDRAVQLAETMVEIGNRAGRRFKAILTDMNQPLGFAVGNSLEVIEAIRTLRGEGPADLTELCLILGGYMVWLAGKAESAEDGYQVVAALLKNGAGLRKLAEMIAAQGGDSRVVDDLSLLPSAKVTQPVYSPSGGWVRHIDCRGLGIVAMELGAGREKLGDVIRPEVGLKVFAKQGGYLKQGDLIAEIHAADEALLEVAEQKIIECFHLSGEKPAEEPLIRAII